MSLPFLAALKESAVNSLTQTIETLGESKMEQGLQILHEKDLDAYKADISASKVLVTHLQPIVLASATKIDDMALAIIWDAATASAKTNNVSLV